MIRRVRLFTGLVMLSYVAMHLLNHALGLVSLAAMERVLRGVYAIWSQYPTRALLYGSFFVHYSLALWALWHRRTLHLRVGELSQIILGFAIPIMLARHVTVNRIADSFLGTDTGYYAYELWTFFVRAPWSGVIQMTVLVVAWGHAMFGLHFWLKVRPGYQRWQAPALAGATLVPVLALLGAITAGRQVATLAQDPGWRAAAFANMTMPTPQAAAAINTITTVLTWLFVALVVVTLTARYLRRLWLRRHGVVRISYPDGRYAEVIRGTSVLEASRLARIPHASVCGGRGRCSTCRVRVRAPLPGPPPPNDDELRVLRRIHATENVRLACMLRPTLDIEVTPLLPPFAQSHDASRRVDLAQGGEREIAIMFVDIRGFTALSEGRLPYDIVFILNRYFAAMGRAVETAGGRVDKFIGDGVMALFGIASGPLAGCREALTAARLISLALVELNESLRAELPTPLRIGIGIHAGPTIVGEMGYNTATTITAIGDAVNTASRLESLTKEFHCELVVSEDVIGRAGLDYALFDWHRIEIRGKHEPLEIAVIRSGRSLPEAMPELPPRAFPMLPGETNELPAFPAPSPR